MIVFVFAVCVSECVCVCLKKRRELKTEGLDSAYAPEQSRHIHWPMVCVKNCLMGQTWGKGISVRVQGENACVWAFCVHADVCKIKLKCTRTVVVFDLVKRDLNELMLKSGLFLLISYKRVK